MLFILYAYLTLSLIATIIFLSASMLSAKISRLEEGPLAQIESAPTTQQPQPRTRMVAQGTTA